MNIEHNRKKEKFYEVLARGENPIDKQNIAYALSSQDLRKAVEIGNTFKTDVSKKDFDKMDIFYQNLFLSHIWNCVKNKNFSQNVKDVINLPIIKNKYCPDILNKDKKIKLSNFENNILADRIDFFDYLEEKAHFEASEDKEHTINTLGGCIPSVGRESYDIAHFLRGAKNSVHVYFKNQFENFHGLSERISKYNLKLAKVYGITIEKFCELRGF